MDSDLVDQFRAFLTKVARKTNRSQFGQEPNYTAAFFGNLNGEVFTSSSGHHLSLTCSISDDRGPNSPESKTGIDIGLVVQWVDPHTAEVFEKAVILQAKNFLEDLSSVESIKLNRQCQMMRGVTSSYAVMDCPFDGSIPKVARGSPMPPYWALPLVGLDDYLIDTVFVCNDGDTSVQVIEKAKRASRSLTIRTDSPKPTPRRAAKVTKKL